MSSEFIRCEYCNLSLTSETCPLAAYRAIIDGKEHVFCCKQCAQRYIKRKKRASKKE